MARARPEPPWNARPTRSGEQDVSRPEAACGQRQGDAGRIELSADAREHDDTGAGEQRPEGVLRAARHHDGQAERPDELERHGQPERDAVDREVEAGVHRGQDEAEEPGQSKVARVVAAEARSPERDQDDAGEGGAQKRRPDRAELVEQRRCERRAELDGGDRGEHQAERRHPASHRTDRRQGRVARAGIEPATPRFSAACSTN